MRIFMKSSVQEFFYLRPSLLEGIRSALAGLNCRLHSRIQLAWIVGLQSQCKKQQVKTMAKGTLTVLMFPCLLYLSVIMQFESNGLSFLS
jgi:hypothetical protein